MKIFSSLQANSLPMSNTLMVVDVESGPKANNRIEYDSKSKKMLFTNESGINISPANLMHPRKYPKQGTEERSKILVEAIKKTKAKNSTEFAKELSKVTGYLFEPAGGFEEEDED